MSQWVPRKDDTLAALAAEILHNYGTGRAIVAVDGVDGAGKTRFADALAEAITATGHPAFRASVDGFHRPRAERHARGRDSAEGFYRDSYDYDAFRTVLIEPFRAGERFRAAAFDHRADAPVHPEPSRADGDAVLVVDGIFLQRPELRGLWNYTVWLDVPTDVAERRLLGRDGDVGAGDGYRGGQELYATEAGPRERASAIVDNTDVDVPRRVFADSC